MSWQSGRMRIVGMIMSLLFVTAVTPAWADEESPPAEPAATPRPAAEPVPVPPAASPPLAAPAQEPAKLERYGLPIVAADIVSVGLWLGAVAADSSSASPALLLAGLASWLSVPPLIHGLHRNGKGLLLSLFARALIPPLTAVLFAGLTNPSCHSDACDTDLSGAGIGFLVGALAVAAVDPIFLARAPVPAAPRVGLAVLPSRGGARLAFGGYF